MATSVACCLPGAVSSGDVAGRPLAGALREEALFLAVHTYCTRCFPPDAQALRDAKLHAWVSGPLCSSFLNCTAALSFTRGAKEVSAPSSQSRRPQPVLPDAPCCSTSAKGCVGLGARCWQCVGSAERDWEMAFLKICI